MRLFRCQNCGQLLYFENTRCERCASRLGFVPERATLMALAPEGELWRSFAHPDDPAGRFCVNAAEGVCNWIVPANSPDLYCAACRHNRTVPDLSIAGNRDAWQKLELAKHRLIYTLIRLGLPRPNRIDDPCGGLAFDFLADPVGEHGPGVMTGHDEGVVTLAVAEADDVERERRRVGLGEPYRTLLGHFRHEVGHFYWNRLVRDGGRLDQGRAVFGDDTQDYGAALQSHYASGPPAGWQDRYVSPYAASHPWEDFAETWAHYLHIVDTLEMAEAFGIHISPRVAAKDEGLSAKVNFDPYCGSIERLVDAWLPLTYALNNLNRCLGERDIYPFILSPEVIRKLGFIHEIVHARCTPAAAA
jgi:hypothetical protein